MTGMSGLWVAIVAATSLFATPVQAAKAIRDIDITHAVETDLWLNEAVPSHNIDVTTKSGIVTLTGSVYNLLARREATKIAEDIRGVRAVVNEITVRAVERPDLEIQGDVMDALRSDPATSAYGVSAEVHAGVVVLSGKVNSYAEKGLCTDVAEGVRGVKGVENNIQVSYDQNRTDKQIQEEIQALLEDDVRINAYGIEVQVKKGLVTLSGTVGSAAEKSLIKDKSWVAGVQAVDDSGLKVDPWMREKMQREVAFTFKNDKGIEKAVKDAFAQDPRVWSYEIEPESRYGSVTLRGTVDNLAAKEAAGQDARNTVGVWRVKNFVKVRPSEQVSDADLTTNVKKALQRDPYLDADAIEVSVHDGKVYLHGSVDSEFQKSQAADAAYRVKGVVDVADYLTVNKSWPWKSDWAIEEDVQNELYWDAGLGGSDVNVSVDDGVVTLTGNVNNWRQYSDAVRDAYKGGAKSVKNELHVRNAVRPQ